MNDGREMEVHYIDTGFPYTAATESFMDFFQSLTHMPLNYALASSMLVDQESVYWSLNMNPYKFGWSGPESTSYYDSYEVNDHFSRMEINRGEWGYLSTLTMDLEEPATTEYPSGRDGITSMQTFPEEC